MNRIWIGSVIGSDRAPASLLDLIRRAEGLASFRRLRRPSAGAAGARILPTPLAIRGLASELEGTPEFQRFEIQFSGTDGGEFYTRDVLRRSRFYHRLVNGGYEVHRFGEEEIDHFGPVEDCRDSFFPDERLDRSWFSQQWFLVQETSFHERPTVITLLRDDAIDLSWKPLVVLATARRRCFAVPIHLHVERDWKLQKIAWSEPREDYAGEEPVPSYERRVRQEEWDGFLVWARCAAASLDRLANWRPLAVGAQRFVRATLLSNPDGSVHSDWDTPRFEQVFLNYWFALEAMLGSGGAEQRATRAAILVAGEAMGRKHVFEQLREAGRLRNRVVHGGGSAQEDVESLLSLREIVRRVLQILLLAGRDGDGGQVKEWIEDIALSPEAQRVVQRFREQAARMPLEASGDP